MYFKNSCFKTHNPLLSHLHHQNQSLVGALQVLAALLGTLIGVSPEDLLGALLGTLRGSSQ